MNLSDAQINNEVIVNNINIDDYEIKSFLFSLGLYSGEKISIVKKTKNNCIVLIKNARYGLDENICKLIEVQEI